MNNWQPIETVPFDGKPVLVWMPEKMLHSHIQVATFRQNVILIGGRFNFDVPSQPTHWSPLPEDPFVDEKETVAYKKAYSKGYVDGYDVGYDDALEEDYDSCY